MDENTRRVSLEVEETLHRVVSLITDEMICFSWNLKDGLQGIKESASAAIDLLQASEEQKMESVAVSWLINLEAVAYEAEDFLRELSYEMLCQKVDNISSLGHIRFLKNVVFSSQLAHKVGNINDGRDRLRPLERTRLRRFLAFFGSFPKDFRVQKTELIQLWMAAGLLQSYDEGSNDLFNSSVLSRVLEVVEKDEDGNGVIYKIRGNEQRSQFFWEYEGEIPVPYSYVTDSSYQSNSRTNKIRSLILDGVSFPTSWKLKRLAILVFLNNQFMETLPSPIGSLKHLTYLDVSNTRIRALPEFITTLYNLQTLRFLQCKELHGLPTNFKNLINLKNIAFSFEHQMPLGLGLLTCLETLSFFVVGSDRRGSIQELRYLNGIRGHLEITRLEEVRDTKEAKRANMQQKEKIDGLTFQWSYGAHDRCSRDEELLEGLQPHPGIQMLKIKYYMGENWPSWMLCIGSSRTYDRSVVTNLVSLTLEQCWSCVQLPCLGNLPRLQFLTMRRLAKVECIHNELLKDYYNARYYTRFLFRNLKSLSLSWMENLVDWYTGERPLDDKRVVMFPRLETLSIQSCAKLTSLPIKDLSKLVKMEIKDCNEMRFLFREQKPFGFPLHLSIEGCPKLTYLPNWFLYNKRSNFFRVKRCEWLKLISDNLGVQQHLPSLELNCCKRLTFFSGEMLRKLTKLEKLSIGAFSEKLDDFRYLNGIKHLTQLKELEIWGSDFFGRKMSTLPYQLQDLVRLKSLKIMGFTTMETLPEWFSGLRSLQCLSLNYCWHLKYQPTTTIVQQLPNLKQLYIYGCHNLEENKSQWHEFSQITEIRIHFSQSAE